MAQIKINNENIKFGKLTVEREKIYNDDDSYTIKISGVAIVHDYYEEIFEFETERYLITGVDIQRETFGTNDNNICYYFTAENIEVKPDYVPDDILWELEEREIDKEIADGEFWHSYAFNEGIQSANKRAIALGGDNNEG